MQHIAVRSLHLYIKEQVMMESKRLECLLDLTQHFRARLHELHQQQHRLCLESMAIMAAQADLPISISSVKGWKGATPYFQTTGAAQWRDMEGKENIAASDSTVRSAQPNSCKASGAKGRKRRKPLVASKAVNQSSQFDASSICTRLVDGGQLEEDVVLQQQRGGNEELVHSMEGNESRSLSVMGNEELVHSVEENNESMSKSMRPLRNSSSREAEDSVPNLGNPRTSRGAVPSGGKVSQVKIEVADTPMIDVDAPRLTRARAKVLQSNVTIARGEPPLKKLRGRKGHLKSTSISPPAEKNETAEKVQDTSPLEQQSKKGSLSVKPPVVQQRNTRANSELHAIATHENAGRNGAIGQGEDMKVQLENVPPNTTCTADESTSFSPPTEKNETAGKVQNTSPLEQRSREGWPSEKRPAMKSKNTGADSQLQAIETYENVGRNRAIGQGQDMKVQLENVPPKMSCTAEEESTSISLPAEKDETAGKVQNASPLELQSREGWPSEKPPAVMGRNTRANSELHAIETHENVGKTVGIGQGQDLKVNLEDVPPNISCSTEEEEEENVGRGRSSKKSRTSLGNSRLNSQAEADACKVRKADVANAAEYLLPNSHIPVEDHNRRAGSRRIREVSTEAALREIDGELGKLGTVVMIEIESMHRTVTNQPRTRSNSSREASVLAAYSSPLHERNTIGTHENVGRVGAIGHGQDMKRQLEDVPPNTSCTTEEEEEEKIGKGRPSKKSRRSSGNARLSLQAEADACKVGKAEDAKAAERLLPNPHIPVEDYDSRGRSGRIRELSEDAALREIDGTPGKLDTVVTNEIESVHRTVTDQSRTKSKSSREAAVLAAYSSRLHSDESKCKFTTNGGGSHSMDERDRMDLAQADDMVMPLAHSGIASEVRSPCNSANMIQVNEADLDGVNSLRVDRVHVHGDTDSRSKCLVSGVGFHKRKLSRVESPFKDSTDAGAKPSSVVSSPPPINQFVQRNTDITVVDHPELKEEGTNSCARSPVQGGKEVGTFVKLLERASEPSNALGHYHMEVSSSTNYAPPALKSAQYGSELRLSRLMSRKHAELSFTVADAAGEDLKYDYRRMKAPRFNDGRAGLARDSEITENGQRSQWACNRLEPMDCSPDESMPFSIDEPFASLQNKKTTDLLLELWKRGGLQTSCLTAEDGPSSPAPHYTVDVIDEVYRSVVVRESGGNAAAPSLTLPVTNWSSAIFHNMIGAAPECRARLMETDLPLSDEADKREPTEADSLEHRNSDQEEEIMKPSSPLMKEQEQDLDTRVRELTEVDFLDDGKSGSEGEIIKTPSLLIQEQGPDTQLRELTEVDSPDDGESDEEEIMNPSSLLIKEQEQDDTRVRELTEDDSSDDGESDEEEIMNPSSLLIKEQEQDDTRVRELTEDDSSDDGESDEEEIMNPSSLLIKEQDDTRVRELTEVDSLDNRKSDQEGEIIKPPSLLIQEQGLDTQLRELTEVDSPDDGESDQEEEMMKPFSLLIQEQDPDMQDSVSAFANSGIVECSQEIDTDCEVSFESEFLSNERNMNKHMVLSRVEEEPEVSRHEDRPQDDVADPVVNPSCNPGGSVHSLPQVLSYNNGNAPSKPFSNLIASMKSFVPVRQQAAPSFLPDGKRVVKVKALIAAEAARKAEENGDMKDWRLKRARRIEENASSGMEKDATVEPRSRPLKESVDGSSRLDGGESSCGSQLSPKKKVLLPTRSNSRNLFSPDAKSKANLGNENKVKKNQAELKRIEEERRRQLLATRQMKEDVARQMKEDLAKKNRQRQEILKQRKDQNKLVAEHEDKGQRHQGPEEAEREKKEMQEKIKLCTPRLGEKENLHGEELNLRGAGTGLLQAAGYARPGQTTPPKIRSNLLGPGSLPLRSAVRVPVISKDKRTAATVAMSVQPVPKKGRHPSSISSSSSKLLALNPEPSSLPSLNVEPFRLPSFNAQSSRLPPSNAEPARISSMTAESAEESRHISVSHTISSDNTRPTDVRQVGTGTSVPFIQTPRSGVGVGVGVVVVAEEDEDEGPTSYEMSPYKESDDEDDEDQPEKIIPRWASRENLKRQLLKQLTLDPDDIFAGSKTCSLKDVFGTTGSRKIQDFGKRSGSGDWFQDRVSWREELQYKINMGYMSRTYPS